MILYYWYLLPSSCIVLLTVYFSYRVLIGYVNTPKRKINQLMKTKQEFIYRRANYLYGACICDKRAEGLGIYLPPCDYCKGLKLGARKEKCTPF